jgi:hypothetical protein
MGYDILSGKCFTIYIHNRLAAAKQMPHKANCQFMNTDFQKAELHENGFILFKPNFSNTCPRANNRLWSNAMGMSFIIISRLTTNH